MKFLWSIWPGSSMLAYLKLAGSLSKTPIIPREKHPKNRLMWRLLSDSKRKTVRSKWRNTFTPIPTVGEPINLFFTTPRLLVHQSNRCARQNGGQQQKINWKPKSTGKDVLGIGSPMPTTGTFRARASGEFHCPFGAPKTEKKVPSLVQLKSWSLLSKNRSLQVL